jgi:hypothetical protein
MEGIALRDPQRVRGIMKHDAAITGSTRTCQATSRNIVGDENCVVPTDASVNRAVR